MEHVLMKEPDKIAVDFRLIAEQLSHVVDLLKADNRMLTMRVESLEKKAEDQEARLRTATDGVTQFKVWSGLAAGGSGLVSIIALIRAFLGGG